MWRVPSALVVAPFLASAFLATGPAQADLVYVLNSGDASVSVIDSQTRTEIRRIPMLREPHHVIMTPDNREVMVADSAANELVFVNPDSAEVTRRQRISNPYHLSYSPDGKYLVINSLRRNQVDIYQASDMQLLARLPVRSQPSHMAFSPDSRMVFISLQGSRTLMAIDLAERKPVWTVEVGPQPAGVLWHNDRLLVGVMGGDYVSVVNPAEQRVERQITTAKGAHTVWLSPDGQTLYVNSRVDSAITLLDATTLAVKARWELPGGPDDIAFAPDGKLWVTLRWIARIAIVDPTNGQYETLHVGRSPHGILLHPTLPSQPVAATRESEVPASTTPPAAEPRPERSDALQLGGGRTLPAPGLVGLAQATEPPSPPAKASPSVATPAPPISTPAAYRPWWRGLTWR
jgi:YVTN family beta-propeller protein